MASIGLVQYARFLGVNRVTAMAQKLQPELLLLGSPSPPYSVRKLIQAAGYVVAARTDVVQKPWAILLLKWKDFPTTEPYPISFYQNLFTTSGAGTMNLTDFYRDASLRKLDVTGSEVFGWFTVNANRFPGPWPRSEQIALAALTAAQNHVDLSPYAVVVASFNVQTDLFGEPGWAVCDAFPDPNSGRSSLSPSIIAQEIGHGYGLQHSRIQGSSDDYKDQWDVMSTQDACFMTPDPTLTQVDSKGRKLFWIGPMLNAANMYGRGWLPESRVLTKGGNANETIMLRPLTRPDLPGFLVARIGGYWVEFRVEEGWDAGIPNPAVLVHWFDDQENHSYIQKGTNGQTGLVGGDIFQIDPPAPAPFVRLMVLTIDSVGYTATIQVEVKL